jgi:hypothetical protein
MRPPRRDHYLAPATDEHSVRVLEEAVEALGSLRGLPPQDDAGVVLHLLRSLELEVDRLMPRAVADARDQQYSWAAIADLLGVTRASAWQRYSTRRAADPASVDPDG